MKNSLFELQSPPWFRSADLGFGRFAGFGSNFGCFASLCLNLWSGILELRSDLECLFRVGFRSGSGGLFLYGLLPILNFVGSWVLVKPNGMTSAFLGGIRTNELKDKRLHLKVGFLQAEEPILQRMNPSATVLLLQYYLHLPLVGT